MLRSLVFLFVFFQIVFYDSITIVPKIIGIVLVLLTLIRLFKGEKIHRLPWPFMVILYISIHALITLLFDRNIINSVSTPSILITAIFIVFLFQAIVLTGDANAAIDGFIFGIGVNFFLGLFFPEEVGFYEEGSSRMNGTLGNANHFGYMLNLTIGFVLLRKEVLPKWFLFPWVLITGVFILWSGSKTSILLFLLITILILTVKDGRIGATTVFRGTIVIGIVMGLITFLWQSDLIYTLLPKSNDVVWTRLTYISNLVNGNINELAGTDINRINMIKFGLDNWTDNILFGRGFDSFAAYSGFDTYSHNNLVENLYNGGLIGFLMFYSLYPYFIRSLSKSFQGPDRLSIYILAIVYLVMEFSRVLIDDKLSWIILVLFMASVRIKKMNYA